ncbi:hypothetical protein D9758_007523 [Tetrapyrgos nigripes]|uniref:DUF6535 domain-containing protein n=1 Tax=Tetrapyrgos nigripes TaxID=182062 RepID=A0A8H5LHG1_9AGAR|nr:hypothetical protein D9758_007523 [Tetrapyrgos nigripes]
MEFKWLTKVLDLLRFSEAPGDVESHPLRTLDGTSIGLDDTSSSYGSLGGLDNDREPHKSPKKPFQPTADNQACGKMWSIYIGEAERYDQALLKGWKEDMAGMLLFSALYSASLTAFLIESYKTLQPDPAQDTVSLLSKISQQLSNSTVPPSEPPSFETPMSAIVCNVLWFLSLALALTCSLLATFVQQWTRDFLHKTTLTLAPTRQARVFAYMYFGLCNFGMHSFVDVIPILLHVSLFLFFGGLVAFLFPVNRIITYIMIGILGVFLIIYTALTVIPLVWLNAPYRTPLSGAVWRFGNAFGGFLARKHGLYRQDETLTEGLLEKSLQGTSERDRRALVFTMQSLTDDDELLPMIEAIQDVLYYDNQKPWKPDYIRRANVDLIMPLIMTDDPEVNIISRITQYLKRSQVVLQDSPPHGQGMPSVYSLVYTLMYMLVTTPQTTNESQILNGKHVQTHLAFTEDLLLHITTVSWDHRSLSSTLALLRFRWISCIRDVVASISRVVDDMKKANGQNIPASALQGQISHLNKIWESLDESRMDRIHILTSLNYSPFHGALDFHQFPRTLELAGEALKKWGMSVEHSTEPCPAAVPEELEATLATLQQDDTWNVTCSTILFEYLQLQVVGVWPEVGISEFPHDFEHIWGIIYPHRLPLYMVDLPMDLGGFYMFPLETLLRWLLDQSTAIDDKVDLWMEKYMQLFFSIKEAQSNTNVAISSRNLFLEYFSQRGTEAVAKPPHDSSWINCCIYQDSYRHLVGECVIQNMRHETVPESLTCEAAFLFSLFCTKRGWPEPALLELWKILDDSDITSSTQNTDILFLRITLSLINIYQFSWGYGRGEESQSMEATLLQQYLSDGLIPPSSPETLRLSLWVALQTEWLDQLTRNRPFAQLNLCNLLCRDQIEFLRKPTDFIEVNQKLQIRFAEIYSNFIEAMVSELEDAWPDKYLDRVHPSVYGFFADYRNVFQWDWITDLKCAKTIMEAIQKYRSRFDRGEEIEGQSSLFARCLEVRGQLPASDSDSEDVQGEGGETAEDAQGEGDETGEKCISLHEDVGIWVRGHPSSYN